MKEILKRSLISFAISSFCGMVINLLIDCIVNMNGIDGFVSMPPGFRALFPTTAMAAYVNCLLYGLIGFVFAFMTLIFEVERLGFLVQSLIYFLATGAVCVGVTIFLWQLHHYPHAFFWTLAGYAVSHAIVIAISYRNLKRDIEQINEAL